jgi:hypothetical protein
MALNEGMYTGEFILTESPGTISRENVTVTVAASTVLSPGQVLGKLTATGKYVPFDDTASDGSESAAGILYSELDNSASLSPADFDGVVINAVAEVRGEDLEWGSADDTVGIPQLEALFVKVRG